LNIASPQHGFAETKAQGKSVSTLANYPFEQLPFSFGVFLHGSDCSREIGQLARNFGAF
jgi:hypothetical protein